MKQKITYISIINAIAIIAVIIGHLDVTGINNDPNTPVANVIAKLGRFQMPLFMCMSGFLFAITSGYTRPYRTLVVSKVKRLIVPFLFLSLFTFGFKMCLPSSMLEHRVGLTPEYIFKIFFIPFRGPVPHLWFVVSLFTMFLLTPIFKRVARNNTTSTTALLFLAIISTAPDYTEILALDKTLNFIVWFYLGIVAGLHGWAERVNTWPVLIASGIAYIILLFFVNIPLIDNLLTLLLGIIFIFALSHKLAELRPKLFGWWRNNTYQIYLLHMFPIMVCKYIYNRHLIDNNDVWFWCVWAVSLASAIVLPTVVAKIAEKLPEKLRMLIGL